MGVALDFNDQTGDLPLAMLRMLDLARALAREPQLLLLDEITAALPSDLAERVFEVARQLKAQNRAVLFITHRLAEVIALCDRATVLRDGEDVGTLVPTEGGEAEIVEYMLGPEAARAAVQAAAEDGAPVAAAPAAPAGAEAPALAVRDLRAGGALEGVSLTLGQGEILGVAALEGQGQDVLFETLAGQRRATGGEIVVHGRPLNARTPYDAIRAGLVLVPADRLHALLPQRSVRENIAAPRYNSVARWGPINIREEGKRVGEAIARLRIDTRAGRQVRRLSGGNAQKVTIARWLASGFGTMLCFDPTRGIDVGTKRQIYTLLRELAAGGASILLFTSELAEIPLVCDRVIVLYAGQVVAELPARQADEATILHAAHGLVEEQEPAA
jgi:ribose transport system ATP-binding protein